MATPPTSAPFSWFRAWFWASRPFSLGASVVPVLVGSALALEEESLRWLLFVLALAGSVLIQVATNLTDEYSDHRRSGGAAKYLAPHKVIQRGLLSERAVLAGLLVTFGAGIGIGLIIVWQVGWPILAVGLAGVPVAYLYSGGPRPLGGLGLGEAAVFVLMGPVMVMASYYVQVQEITWRAFVFSLPVAFLVAAVLHCNNMRDIEEDRGEGKRTVASALGVGPSKWVYVGLLAAAYGWVMVLVATGTAPLFLLLALAAIPQAVATARRLWNANDRGAMNGVMVSTSALHGVTGAAMAAGLVLGAVVG